MLGNAAELNTLAGRYRRSDNVACLDETKIDRESVLEFFLRLARFEFVLKASGYADADDRRVDPAWERFARDIRG